MYGNGKGLNGAGSRPVPGQAPPAEERIDQEGGENNQGRWGSHNPRAMKNPGPRPGAVTTTRQASAPHAAAVLLAAFAALLPLPAQAQTVNTPATGAPTISGTAQVDQTLTASTSGISDADGLADASFSYQWIRVEDDGVSNPVDIPGATGSTYTPTADDVGGKLKLKVSFTDDAENPETLTSAAYPSSGTVLAANASPVFPSPTATRSLGETFGLTVVHEVLDLGETFTATDADGDTIRYHLQGPDEAKFTVDTATGQLRARVEQRYDYEAQSSYQVEVQARDGNGGTGSVDVVIIIENDTSETPMKPVGVSARWTNATTLVPTWTAPENPGRPQITGYEVAYGATAGGHWETLTFGAGATSATLTALQPDTEYWIQIRAVNGDGGGAWAYVPGKTNEPPKPVQGTHALAVTISEADPIGTTVAEVDFTDPEGDPIRCRVEAVGTQNPATGLRPLDPRFETYLVPGTTPKCVVSLATKIDFESVSVGQVVLRARDTASENDTGSNYGAAATITVNVENAQEGGTGSIRLEITGRESGRIVPGTVLTVTGSVNDPDGFGPDGKTTIPLSLATWHYADGTPIMVGTAAAQGTSYTVRHEDTGEAIHARVAYDDVLGESSSYSTGSSAVVTAAAGMRIVNLDTRIRIDEPIRFTVSRDRAALRNFDVRFMIEVVNADETTRQVGGIRTIRFTTGQRSVNYEQPLDGDNIRQLHTRRVTLLADDAVPTNYTLGTSGISGDILIEPVEIRSSGLLEVSRAPGASEDYAIGEVLEVDTSAITDLGGLEYTFTSYEWIRTDVVSGNESVVQRGSGTTHRTYTVRLADAWHELHAKVYFTATQLGYRDSESSARKKVAGADGSQAQPLRVLDISFLRSPRLNQDYYGCGDSLWLVAQFNGRVPGRGGASEDLKTMRLRMTLSGRTLWVLEAGHDGDDQTRVKFLYNVKTDDRTSSLYMRDFVFEGFDPNNRDMAIALTSPAQGSGKQYVNAIGRNVAANIDGRRVGNSGHGTVGAVTFFFPGSVQTDPIIDCSGTAGNATAATPLTATLEDTPSNHDGSTAFTFRIAFSAEVEMSPQDMKDHALTVTGGTMTAAARVDGRKDLWEITVAPAGLGAVSILVPQDRACTETGALCTADGQALSTGLGLSVPGPAPVAPAQQALAPLTAGFVSVPPEHDGETAFWLELSFNAAVVEGSQPRIRALLGVTGGSETRIRRKDGRLDRWRIRIEPSSHAAVTVTLSPSPACGATGAVCTEDGRTYTTALATRINGPVGISVADTTVQEGANAQLDFVVSLSRAAASPVTVDYRTRNGTAIAGQDFTATSGTVTFAAGETGKTVTVPVLDDVHDEGSETMKLKLANASGGQLTDRKAIGTITNSDPLQRAWLSRFGRTAATHVTDAVGERLRTPSGQASQVTVGGYRLPLGQPASGTAEPGGATTKPETTTDRLASLLTGLVGRALGLGPAQPEGGGLGADPWADQPGTDPRLGQSQLLQLPTVRLRDVLLGSSFRLNLGDDAGPGHLRLTAWGRVAGTRFDGRDGDLTLDGDVLTGTVGIDGTWGRWLLGLAAAHTQADGTFAGDGMSDRGQGTLDNTLTSIHPYVQYAVTDRLNLWGMVGYGWGDTEVTIGHTEILESDTTFLMGAVGGRGVLLAAAETGGFELATRSDAMLTQTSLDDTAGLAGAEGEAHRLRVVLEGSRGFTWPEGRTLTPTLEVGLRHDWGDAETGFGLEVGGRVQYADPRLGLTVEGTVRGLVAHEASEYDEWGASANVRLAPGMNGQGLSLTLSPTWGAASSGIDGLWSRQTTVGLAPQGNRAAPTGRLNAEVSYGFTPFGPGLLTPYAGTVLTDGAARTYRLGTRWTSISGLTLNLEGQRQAPAADQPINQGLYLQIGWGF